VEVRAKLFDEDIPEWDKSGWEHYHYKIYFKNSKHQQVSFDYWTSHKDWEEKKSELNREDLLEAACDILQDALEGYGTFEDFLQGLWV